MVIVVRPLFADAVVNGLALLSVGLVGYLVWLRVREWREERRKLRLRERDRRDHWGYV